MLDDPDGRRQLHHDLRAPLVVISGFGQLLAGDGEVDPALRRDYAQRIVDASAEIERLLQERLGRERQPPSS